MADYGFQDNLDFSVGQRRDSDIETLMALIDGAASVRQAPKHLDLQGVDYVVTLRGGAEVNVDVKTRRAGSKGRWHRAWEPDMALETWSVCPSETHRGKTGWTLNEASITDLVLFTFDRSETENCYLVGFQPLRIAFRRHFVEWKRRFGPLKPETTDGGRYKSEALFVPATAVLDGITRVSRAEYQTALKAE